MDYKKYTLYKYPLFETVQAGSGRKKRNNEQSKYTVEELNKVINKEIFAKIEFPQTCWEYPYTPAIFPAQARVVALGDIHGDYELAIKMLELAGAITRGQNNDIKWIGGSTHIVQVGDQIDRCRPIGELGCTNPQTTYNDEASDIKILKLFTELDKEAILHGGRVISLFGNHELLNAQGNMSYVSYEGLKEFANYTDPNNTNLKFKNPIEARKHAFSPKNEIGKLLGCTRVPALIIGSNLFVHAGIVDSIIDFLKIHEESDLETINIALKKWLLGLVDKNYVGRIIESSGKSMFWTRILGSMPPGVNTHDKRCVDNISKVLKILKIGKIIIGHTPQSFTYNKTINATCGDVVWRVDNASSKTFHKFDYKFLTTGTVDNNRRPQVLEITNDVNFRVIM